MKALGPLFNKNRFPIYIQKEGIDCGVACIQMVASYFGDTIDLNYIRTLCAPTREGVSLGAIGKALEALNYRTIGGLSSVEKLMGKATFPCILYWDQSHFVVLYKIIKKKRDFVFVIGNPSCGLQYLKLEEFVSHWIIKQDDGFPKGVLLLIEKIGSVEMGHVEKGKPLFRGVLPHFLRYNKYYGYILVGLMFCSLIQLSLPFLTQSLVDIGIGQGSVYFIKIILFAQLSLIVAKMLSEFIHGWLVLHISTRVNITMLSDFIIKLMKIPMGFFDVKLAGDIVQRFSDFSRVENFITKDLIAVMYSLLTFVVFSLILILFSPLVFVVFLLGSIMYVFWLVVLMGKRKTLDYQMFDLQSENYNITSQLITQMQEIKLQGCGQRMRWNWAEMRARLFSVNVKALKLRQMQTLGNTLINESKNIIITFLATYLVIRGELSLGALLAIQFIVGQLNVPVDVMARFIYNLQDVRISLERINDTLDVENENSNRSIKEVPSKNILIKNLNFKYPGSKEDTLININMHIPKNKQVAIVGASGSGKTTLIKLLLQYYATNRNSLVVGNIDLNDINTDYWRSLCGAVMQDGVIFSDTIARNIAPTDDVIDIHRLLYACKMSNVDEFVCKMPLKYDTVIGVDGRSLSQGQKQRILIARAIYKDPPFLFLDEATNALDAYNEKIITNNLRPFMDTRTVIIVAHRLNTVMNADYIYVLDNGRIVEEGTHIDLVKNQSYYYKLIKNQLELGE